MKPENLNCYEGIVLEAPLAEIPMLLAREMMRKDKFVLWKYQSTRSLVDFMQRQRHANGAYSPGDEEREMAVLEQWKKALQERFPAIPFVIDLAPCDSISWYQATKEAPTEDDDEWTIHRSSLGFVVRRRPAEAAPEGASRENFEFTWTKPGFRRGDSGPCEICEIGREYTEPRLSSVHRGIKLIECKHCGTTLPHSSKTIREKVNF